MTGKDYIDEVKLRLFREDVVLNLGDSQVLSYVNRSRRQVQKLTMSLSPERYSRIVRIGIDGTMIKQEYDQSNTYAGKRVTIFEITLPDEFIDTTTLILEWWDSATNIKYRSEARRVDKRELFSVGKHSWNVPTHMRPIYTLERDLYKQGMESLNKWKAYLSGLDISNGQTLLDTSDYVLAEIWYVAALRDLEDEDAERVIPADVEELVVYYTMMYCLRHIQNIYAYASIKSEIKTMEEEISESYEQKKIKETILLPSKEGY